MNTFYIARHGETENNRAKRLSGWVDTPLTARGLEPTQPVIAKLAGLNIGKIYASDMGRAFVTAYVIARGIQYTDEIVRVPDLREVNYGVAAHMKSAEAYELYPRLDRDTAYVPPDGESLAHMQTRVLRAVEKIDRLHTGTAILLVAHSGVMAALRAEHIGQDFGEHNISEAYPHDYLGRFSIAKGHVTAFAEVT